MARGSNDLLLGTPAAPLSQLGHAHDRRRTPAGPPPEIGPGSTAAVPPLLLEHPDAASAVSALHR